MAADPVKNTRSGARRRWRRATAEATQQRSDFSAAGRFVVPERNTPPRAGMRDHDVDQRRRDQQQLGLERRIAHDMRRIGAEQQESHADREQKTEARQRQQQLRHRLESESRAPIRATSNRAPGSIPPAQRSRGCAGSRPRDKARASCASHDPARFPARPGRSARPADVPLWSTAIRCACRRE
jgi:hypothetical protein